MTKPLSVDLRSRVVAAVEGGLSRRQAAARFGVSISSAIRWTSRVRTTGDIRPLRVGGDKRSARIEGFAPVILGAVDAKPDITLAELRELLAEHGASFALSTIWRFFARHKITLKKSQRMLQSRSVPTSLRGVVHGSTASWTSIPSV